jgi:hypothetical protein
MKLQDQQWEFLKDVAKLIQYADSIGYELTGGELYRTKERAALNAKKGSGIAKSLHTQRLAIDFNLFVHGEWRQDSDSHKLLGAYWKKLNVLNRWGGDFKSRPDGNHYERNI